MGGMANDQSLGINALAVKMAIDLGGSYATRLAIFWVNSWKDCAEAILAKAKVARTMPVF